MMEDSGKISCPRCGTPASAGLFRPWQWVLVIAIFPIGLLALLAGKKPNKCSSCGYEWR